MTDTKQDAHAGLMRMAFLSFAKREMPWVLEKPQDDAESLCKTTATLAFQRGYEAISDYARTLTDRISELEGMLEFAYADAASKISEMEAMLSTNTARIAELEAQIEAQDLQKGKAPVESVCNDERMCVPCYLGQDNCDSPPQPGPLPELSDRALATACTVLTQAISFQVQENFGRVPNNEWCTKLLNSREELEALRGVRELPKPKNKGSQND